MRWDRIANAKANLSVDVGLLLRYHLSFVAMRYVAMLSTGISVISLSFSSSKESGIKR